MRLGVDIWTCSCIDGLVYNDLGLGLQFLSPEKKNMAVAWAFIFAQWVRKMNKCWDNNEDKEEQ